MKLHHHLLVRLVLALGFAVMAVDHAIATEAAPTEKIRIATSKNAWTALTLVADAKDFFRDEGLNVELVYGQGGRYSLDALVSSSVEVANIVEVNVAYFGFTGGRDVRVTGTIVRSTGNAIIAKRSAGILKPEDLRGKRLALSAGMTSDIMAHRFLERYGIKKNEVQIVNVTPNAIQTTLLAGGAEAAATWDPFVSNLRKQLRDDAIVFADPSIYRGFMLLAVRPSWEATHRDAVTRLKRAYARASEFVKANPAEAQAIVAQKASMKPESVAENWNLSDYTYTDQPKDVLPEVQRIGQWIHDSQEGYQNKPLPDYSIYFSKP